MQGNHHYTLGGLLSLQDKQKTWTKPESRCNEQSLHIFSEEVTALLFVHASYRLKQGQNSQSVTTQLHQEYTIAQVESAWIKCILSVVISNNSSGIPPGLALITGNRLLDYIHIPGGQWGCEGHKEGDTAVSPHLSSRRQRVSSKHCLKPKRNPVYR